MSCLHVFVVVLCVVATSSQFLNFPSREVALKSHRYRASYLPYYNNIHSQQATSPFYGYNSYHIGRAVPTRHPQYTAILKDIEYSVVGVKKRLPFPSLIQLLERDQKPDPNVEYITMLVVLTNLVDQLVTSGEDVYHRVYPDVVEEVVTQISKNPHWGNNLIRVKTDKMISQIALLKDLIEHKQETECKIPISSECDAIIDQYLEQTTDPLLKGEVAFFVAFGAVVRMFEDNYLSEFKQAASNLNAAVYLRSAEERLKPLVMAGYQARKAMPFSKVPVLRCSRCGALRILDEDEARQVNLN